VAKTKEPAPPKVKPAGPTEVVVPYDLFELPTAFHKAGLAGLILLIESLKARQVVTADEAKYEISATGATVTFTESLVRKLMDDLYDAQIVERRYLQPKKKDNKPVPAKRVDVEEREEKGRIKEVKSYIYDEVEARGRFLRDHYPDEDGLWLKLWRDMLWAVLRPRDKNRIPYQERSRGEPCNEGSKAWEALKQYAKKLVKNVFHTTGLSGSLYPGAQDINAEGVPFEGRAEQNLLLHFWSLTVLVFVPQAVDVDGKTGFVGYTLAVPDVSNLTEFVRDYPKLLATLTAEARGYRPARAVIDLPAEGALAFLEDLAVITGLQVETGELRFSIGGVEYLHLIKEGNNVKGMAAGRVSPNRRLLTGYRAIVCPTGTAVRYRNPLFRRGLLVALLDDEPWYCPFGHTFTTFDADLFIRQPRRTKNGEEKGMPQFANDAARKLRHETALFSSILQRNQDMPESERAVSPRPQTPPPVIINRVVRNYLLTRTAEKTGIKPDKFETADGDIDWKAVPAEFNDAKQKLALSLFLEFRSRKEQAFVDHFAATFFSVTQRFAEPDRLELSDMLIREDRRDDLKTLTLLALSANS
jgi:CRISPR-associated protein Cmx8